MKVAITGANGEIGRILAPFLATRHDVRLGVWDLAAGRDPASFSDPRYDVHRLDVRDPDEVRSFVDGANAVIHLAGERETSADWPRLSRPNIEGTVNVFDACRERSVSKIVFASSNHVTGGYTLSEQRGLNGSEPVRPDSLYGVTKAFGEALGRFMSDAYGISVICLRIGWVLPEPHGPEAVRMWLSPRDLCDLIASSLRAEVPFGIYYGTSRNTRRLWDIGPAMRDLGYAPVDDSEAFTSATDGTSASSW
jgi:NAD+ dependent glucose-6-phosphate dehydrogenase